MKGRTKEEKIQGIGSLDAGVIIVRTTTRRIQGLTTAASIRCLSKVLSADFMRRLLFHRRGICVQG
jgi:hypothetical protein